MILRNQSGRNYTNGLDVEITRQQDIQLNPPTNLMGSNVSETSFDLSWEETFSSNTITGYEIYQDSVLLTTVGAVTTYSVTGLTASTTYDFTIRTVTAQGTSIDSDLLQVTTTAGGSNLVANFTVTPTSGDFPLTVTCNSFSTPSDGTIQFHNWDWGDGDSTAGGFAGVTHTYTTAGVFTITLTIGDGLGNTANTTRDVTVTTPSGNQAPVANFTVDTNSGNFPLTVNFDGTSSTDTDGTISSYSWTFGDGNTGTGSTTSHTYTSAGSYQASLTVIDNDGASNTSNTTTISVSDPSGGGSETVAGVVNRVFADDFTQNSGFISSGDITSIGNFDYATKGFNNGYQGRSLVEMNLNPSGLPSGKWLRTIRPAGCDAHTFTKAIRVVAQTSNTYPSDIGEFWMKMEFFIPVGDWATQNQGKPAYSWTNVNGTSPGTNPTNRVELLYHWFGPNSPKSSGLWNTSNPAGSVWDTGAMIMGIDTYANDSRISNNFSEPVFMTEDADASNFTRQVFYPGEHCVFWVYYKDNTGSNSDGQFLGWWSNDGGANFKKGVNINDMRWTTDGTQLRYPGFVQFYGGNGFGFEPGCGTASQNDTSVNHPVRDWWLYVKELRTQTVNPLPAVFFT